MGTLLRIVVTTALVLGGIKVTALVWPVADSLDIQDALGNVVKNFRTDGISWGGVLTDVAGGFEQELSDEIAKRVMFGAFLGVVASSLIMP